MSIDLNQGLQLRFPFYYFLSTEGVGAAGFFSCKMSGRLRVWEPPVFYPEGIRSSFVRIDGFLGFRAEAGPTC